MKKTLLLLIMLNIGAAGTKSFAQDMNEPPLDTLTRRVSMIQSTLDVMNRIKISGYIQAQFQLADSMGQASVAGGNFAAGVEGYPRAFGSPVCVWRAWAFWDHFHLAGLPTTFEKRSSETLNIIGLSTKRAMVRLIPL